MNKDIDRESKQPVSSKYFTAKFVMDESLSHFQEPKKLADPKTTKKPKAEKPKKAPKRIRGQKDIRAVVNKKKNDLEKYAEDFDKVCKHAGLDVDSEQLQLAIALSKSLQESTSKTDSPENSQSNSTQGRVGKIRTTLLEYGFKVPEIKKSTTNRRLKKKKTIYKLLTTSEEAKKQIVSEKYSEVLFTNTTPSKNDETNLQHVDARLYNLATSVTYCVLNDTNTLYVENLLEKSTSTCNLLRDWSEIPGRPISPILQKPISMNFSEIGCSQDELDGVLSGSLKYCQNIIQSKEETFGMSNSDNISIKNVAQKHDLNNGANVEDQEISIALDAKKCEISLELNENKGKAVSLEEPVVEANGYRSCSPDLFDDEPSVIENTETLTQEIKLLSQNHATPVPTTRDFMDLTECVTGAKENHSNNHLNSESFPNYNVTRRCNDLMEITECAETQLNTYPVNRNATKRISNDFMDITNCMACPETKITNAAEIDVTQSPEDPNKKANVENNQLIPIENKMKADGDQSNLEKTVNEKKEMLNSEPNNIDLTESPKAFKQNRSDDNNIDVCLDLTQSSNSSDELPFISLKVTKNNSQLLDDTIIMEPQEYEIHFKPIVAQEDILDLTQNNYDNQEELDSKQFGQNVCYDKDKTVNTRHQEKVSELRNNSGNKDTNASFFEEYVHDHSDNIDAPALDKSDDNFYKDNNNERPKSSDSQSMNVQKKSKDNLSDDIDLTQNSDSLENQAHWKDNDTCKVSNLSLECESERTKQESQSDIDLTQNSESDEMSQDFRKISNIDTESDIDKTIEVDKDNYHERIDNDRVLKNSQRCSSLGKKDNISIDYDEIYDDLAISSSQQSILLNKSATDNVSNKSKDTSSCSQTSEVFVISDNELDYSMHKSKLEMPMDNFGLGGISIMNEFSRLSSFRRSTNIENNSAAANISETAKDVIEVEAYNEVGNRSPLKHKRVNALATPQKPSCSGTNTVVTPSNNEYIIKTNNVTPMPIFETMSLEDLHSELNKYGVKPFKRKRAIQLLTHIYNQTHPTLETSDEESPCKRRKINSYESPMKCSPRKILSPKKTVKSPEKQRKKTSAKNNSPRKVSEPTGKEKANEIKEAREKLTDLEIIQCSNNFNVNETPFIKEIHCNPEDWVFQKREKAKVHSCRVPLHIAFHNYVLSRRWLNEAILCYEPVNIDDIHKDLVSYGHKYDPKDLLKFMDKKCITVKTTDNDGRNHKR